MKNYIRYWYTCILIWLHIKPVKFYTVTDNSYAKCINYPSMSCKTFGKTLKIIGVPFETEIETYTGTNKHTFVLGKDIKTGLIYQVLYQG